MKFTLYYLSLFVTLILPVACETGPSARIMEDDEKNMVDTDGAGAAAFEKLITESVTKLLDRHRGDEAGIQVRRLAFVDLQNRTKEELGEWREQLIDRIQIGIDQHPAYRIVAEELVTAVLSEMGNLPVEKLLLPKSQREFAKVLEKKKSPVQFLMYGSLTRGGTRGDDGRQANYLLTLRLINAATGDTDTEGAMVRKWFRK
ncbi:MAG: hypothetical protein VX951_01530 [Planctomycetota bacterium]|nr:hypothetical protein [Planctomycetota bacterium]